MTAGPRLVQVSVSPGGVPKTPVTSAYVSGEGVEGDGHRQRTRHGGPDRAVCLYALEAIEALRGEGHAIVPGTLGENLTVAGLDWADVTPGRRLRVGSRVVLQVTGYTAPCFTIAGAFADRRFGRVAQARHPGWSRVYARVLAPGRLHPGDPVRLEALGLAPRP